MNMKHAAANWPHNRLQDKDQKQDDPRVEDHDQVEVHDPQQKQDSVSYAIEYHF
jgi:hypothetical protein